MPQESRWPKLSDDSLPSCGLLGSPSGLIPKAFAKMSQQIAVLLGRLSPANGRERSHPGKQDSSPLPAKWPVTLHGPGPARCLPTTPPPRRARVRHHECLHHYNNQLCAGDRQHTERHPCRSAHVCVSACVCLCVPCVLVCLCVSVYLHTSAGACACLRVSMSACICMCPRVSV